MAVARSTRMAKQKNSLSHKRNQGSKRLMKQIEDHHTATGFKVLINLLPTWKRGKEYTWNSPNWGKTKPVIIGEVTQQVQNVDSETNESENLPDSQDLELRAKASSSSDASKKAMKITCIRCLKVKKSTEKIGSWLTCGYSGCSRLNMHAKCNAVHIPNIKTKGDLLKFCREFIRCSFHMGKAAFPPTSGAYEDFNVSEETSFEEDSSEEDSSEDDFTSQQRLRKVFSLGLQDKSNEVKGKGNRNGAGHAKSGPGKGGPGKGGPGKGGLGKGGPGKAGEGKTDSRTTRVGFSNQPFPSKTLGEPSQSKTSGAPNKVPFRPPTKDKILSEPSEVTNSSSDFSDPDFNYNKRPSNHKTTNKQSGSSKLK